MANVKYFHKLHAHVILKILPLQISSLHLRSILFGGISFMNVFGESVHKFSQQLLCTYPESHHISHYIAPESNAVIDELSEN